MIQTYYFEEIEKGEGLTNLLLKLFENCNFPEVIDEQILSIFCQIILKDDSTLDVIRSNIYSINNSRIVSNLLIFVDVVNCSDKCEKSILKKLYWSIKLEEIEIQKIVDMSLDIEKYSMELTLILNLIKNKGLSVDNVRVLSEKMAYSGNIYDYRSDILLNNKKVIRRYPTGAVSEKVALIMPSLLKLAASKFDFISPFLVAKTLGFTGGTWDKLSCIPNFTFPMAGVESISILKDDNICMTVSNYNYNPSDRFLYQLRSITNTVDSLPLIVASISSKQIANPVDLLLLDIRYGKNAFLENREIGEIFFSQVDNILSHYGIKTIAEFTDTNEIFGSAVGNYLEVIESICIMKNQNNYGAIKFDSKLLQKQKELVILMTSKLLSSQFNASYSDIENFCRESFLKRDIFKSFKQLLKSHGVSYETINKINNDLAFGEAKELKEFPVLCHKSGTLKEIYQKNIGNFVNVNLSGGVNRFKRESQLYDGILLIKQINCKVQEGDVKAMIYSNKFSDTRLLSNKFFKII